MKTFLTPSSCLLSYVMDVAKLMTSITWAIDVFVVWANWLKTSSGPGWFVLSEPLKSGLGRQRPTTFSPTILSIASPFRPPFASSSGPLSSRSLWTRPTPCPRSLTSDAFLPLDRVVLLASEQASKFGTYTPLTTVGSVPLRHLRDQTSALLILS